MVPFEHVFFITLKWRGGVPLDNPSREAVEPSNRGFTLGVGLFCITLAMYMFFQSALFALEEVIVDGNQYLRVEEIMSLAGIEMGMNLFDINLRTAEERLKADPRVADAHLVRRLPRGIDLKMKERVPVAYLPFERGFAALDVEGRVLSVSEEARLRLPQVDLPDKPSHIAPGTVLSGNALEWQLQIAELLRPDLIGRITQIQQNDGRFDLMLDNRIRVQLGDTAGLAEKLERLRIVLRSIGSDSSVTEIDLRARTPVLR